MLDALVGRLTLSGVAACAAVAGSRGAAHALARHAARPTFVAPLGHGASVLAPCRWKPSGCRRGCRRTCASRLREDRRPARTTPRAARSALRPGAPSTHRPGPRRVGRADRAGPPTRSRPGPPRLCRADRRGRDDHPVHRQAGRRARRRARRARTRSPASRPPVRARRQPRPGRLCRTAQPVADAKRLARLLCDRIETIDPGLGIEVMTLAATVAEPLVRRQTASAVVEEPTPDVSDLVDLLANRIGPRAVYRAAQSRATCPSARSHIPRPVAGHRRRLARPLAAPCALARPAGADRRRGAPARPSAVSFTWRGVRRRVRHADGAMRQWPSRSLVRLQLCCASMCELRCVHEIEPAVRRCV